MEQVLLDGLVLKEMENVLSITRKAIGFKSLRLNYCEISQATSKCQIAFW